MATPQAEPTHYIISAAVINKVAVYLGEQPFKFAQPLFNEIQKDLQPFTEKPDGSIDFGDLPTADEVNAEING